jgi:hypothetical protein
VHGAWRIRALSIQRLEGSRPRLRRMRALWKLNGAKGRRRGAPGPCGGAQQITRRARKLAVAEKCCEESVCGSRKERFVRRSGKERRIVAQHAGFVAGESCFMRQHCPQVENEVAFRQRGTSRRPPSGQHTWGRAKDHGSPWCVACLALSAATSRVTESKEARKRHVAGWPRSRSAGCARSHPEASATGSDAGIHRVRESSVAVHFYERSHANET